MPSLLGLRPASATPVTVTLRVASNHDALTAVIWASWRGADEQIYWLDRQGRQMNTNLRFTNLTVPQGATITDARLTLYARGNRTGAAATDFVTIGAEQVDNATQVTSYANHTSRMGNVGVTVDWLMTNMTVNQALESPNLAAVVQQVVNRAGWVSGNAIQFFCANNPVANMNWNFDVDMQNYAVNNGAQYYPMLEVTYLA